MEDRFSPLARSGHWRDKGLPALAAWLDRKLQDGAEALAQAQAAALSHFQPQPVSTFVIGTKNQGERCIEPVAQRPEITSSRSRQAPGSTSKGEREGLD
jgi:hypothetical protein